MWSVVRQNVLDPVNYRQDYRVDNFIIDFYLDEFRKRRESKSFKHLIIQSINYFTLISKLICIFALSLSFILKLKYETKLYLFDISMFFGGIEKYNRIMFILCLVFGFVLNIKLRLKKTDGIEEWTQLFQLIRSRVRPLFLAKDSDYTLLYKVIRAARIIYPLFTIVYISSSKFI